MSTRFLHHSFPVSVPCACCMGEGELVGRASGHFSYNHSFVFESFTLERNGQEPKLTDGQREIIELKGDEQYGEAEASNMEHQREMNADIRAEIR
jgi:hypothetical protein